MMQQVPVASNLFSFAGALLSGLSPIEHQPPRECVRVVSGMNDVPEGCEPEGKTKAVRAISTTLQAIQDSAVPLCRKDLTEQTGDSPYLCDSALKALKNSSRVIFAGRFNRQDFWTDSADKIIERPTANTRRACLILAKLKSHGPMNYRQIEDHFEYSTTMVMDAVRLLRKRGQVENFMVAKRFGVRAVKGSK